MVSSNDGFAACNATAELSGSLCTKETCCLQQGQIQYLPTLAGNALFAAILAILIIPHLYFGITKRTWSFMSWISLGLLGEVVGYIGRVMLHNNIFSFDAFLTYLIPLTIAPAFITASIYLCLARVIYILDPNLMYTRLKPMTYTKIFVTFDVISLVLQGAGGGVAAVADDKKTSDMGVNIMIAGLAFQVISLVVFSALCIDFTWRLYKGISSAKSQFITISDSAVSTSGPAMGLTKTPSWMLRESPAGMPVDYNSIKRTVLFKGFIGALVAATILILTRSAYRLAELQGGFGGKLANEEVSFMILEGPMIILACLGLTVFHPGLAMRGLWSMKEFQRKSFGEKLMMNSTGLSVNGSREELAGGRVQAL